MSDSNVKAPNSDGNYSLGERIKYLRTQRNLTQTELAERVELSQGSLAHFESNKKSPSVDTLWRLARALDVNPAIFFVTEDLVVFDLKKIQERYPTSEDLPDRVFRDLVRVTQLARKMGLIG